MPRTRVKLDGAEGVLVISDRDKIVPKLSGQLTCHIPQQQIRPPPQSKVEGEEREQRLSSDLHMHVGKHLATSTCK